MTEKLSAGKCRKLLPGLCNIAGTLLLIIVIAAFLPVTIPRLLGYEIYEVISGSMEPTIPTGSVIYVKTAEPENISEGEIITFFKNDSIITHRVLTNRRSEKEFITGGDANHITDLTPVPYEDLIGRVTFHIPVLGFAMTLFTGKTGKIYAALLVVWGVLLHILSAILKIQEEPQDEK